MDDAAAHGGDSAADELEIMGVISRMAHYGDQGALEDLLSLFTDDAVLEAGTHPVMQPGPPSAIRRAGRAQIEASDRARRDAGTIGPGSNTMHSVSTVFVVLEGATATAHATWQFFTGLDNVPVLAAVGRYELTLRRTPEGWKIQRRLTKFV